MLDVDIDQLLEKSHELEMGDFYYPIIISQIDIDYLLENTQDW